MDKNILWTRMYDMNTTSNIIESKINGNLEKYDTYCNTLDYIFDKFKFKSEIHHINNLIMVVGHCTTYEITIKNRYGITHSTKLSENDGIVDKYTGKEYEGIPDVTNKSTIIGISMECKGNQNYKNNAHKIYHIDVGGNRSFDNENEIKNINSVNDETRYLYSRTPSVFHVNNEGDIILIKSKMSNTRKNLSRPKYETHINNISSTGQIPVLNNIPADYQKKYLKYKMKYLKYKMKY
jgi:hypothetical protein